MLPLPLVLRAVDLGSYRAVVAELTDPLRPTALPWVERTLDAAAQLDPLEGYVVRARLDFVERLRRGEFVELGDARGEVFFTILSQCAFPGFVLYPTAPHSRAFLLGEADGGYGLWLRWAHPALFEDPPVSAPIPLARIPHEHLAGGDSLRDARQAGVCLERRSTDTAIVGV